MAFQPLFTITKVSNDSRFLDLIDATAAYHAVTNPGGYGVPGGPANAAAIVNVVIQMQLLGANPVQILAANVTGVVNTGLKVVTTLLDGVNIVHALYGMTYSNDFTLSNGNKTITLSITGSTFTTQWAGVTYIADPATKGTIYKISSIDATAGTITLFDAYTSTQQNIVKYYTGSVPILVLNCCNKSIGANTAGLAGLDCSCDEPIAGKISNNIMLLKASEDAFACGDYTKAHSAATLLCGESQIFQPCPSC